MIELVDKDITVGKTIFHMLRKIKESLNIFSESMKYIKDSNRTSRCEKYIFDEKYCGI